MNVVEKHEIESTLDAVEFVLRVAREYGNPWFMAKEESGYYIIDTHVAENVIFYLANPRYNFIGSTIRAFI